MPDLRWNSASKVYDLSNVDARELGEGVYTVTSRMQKDSGKNII